MVPPVLPLLWAPHVLGDELPPYWLGAAPEPALPCPPPPLWPWLYPLLACPYWEDPVPDGVLGKPV